MKKQILSFLPGNHPWQNRIYWFDTIDSTNEQAKQMARMGAPQGTVLIAEQQTGGRGRMGRSFESAGGVGVYLSVILRPECPPGELMHLTCAAAVAMCDAVEKAAGFRPQIKWTNDLVFHGKKLGGILTELSLTGDGKAVEYAIVGIGINCCQQTQDFPAPLQSIAASLSMASGRPVNRAETAAQMIVSLHQMCLSLSDRRGMMTRYRKDCMTVGRDVVLVRGETRRYGKALDVDDAGCLVVEFEDGTLDSVSSGEISVRGMYGYT